VTSAASTGTANASAAGTQAPVASKETAYTIAPNMTIAVGKDPALASASTEPGCTLANGVQHVFYIGFDNFHLRRDNANNVANNGDDNLNTDLNIPSDLEQVPALYNFIRGTANAGTTTHPSTANNANYADGRNTTYSDGTPYPGGTLLTNNHTPLISHTSVDFATTYTGVYGDRHGVAVSENSMGVYTGVASAPVKTASGFAYWTDPINISGDSTNVFTTQGSASAVNAPAPWAPFTRAGCDVGAVATTGFVLENANSVASATAASGGAVSFTSADEGLAVHCANSGVSGQPGGICSLSQTDSNVKAVPDLLPSEPGGYSNYYALFGHRFIAPAVNDRLNGAASGGSTTLNLLRAPSTSAWESFNSENGNYTLGYTLAMQKAGIPVTFGYLSDAHDCHYQYQEAGDYSGNGDGTTYANPGEASNGDCLYYNSNGTTTTNTYAFGSGEQAYVNYLKTLNNDFQLFFDQAKAAGFTTANTEFVFYSDENDHAAEATPINGTGATPCDGVTVACVYNYNYKNSTVGVPGETGELTVNVDSILPTAEKQASQPYFDLADSAPDFYVETAGSGSAPSQTSTAVRSFERAVTSATYTDPYTGATTPLATYAADQVELNALHMITADPLRSPTFTVFSPGQDYVQVGTCSGGANVCTNSDYIYIHGDFAPETNTTWAGFVGPGVANLGTSNVWTDHVDLRPTLLALLGLHDDYQTDGRIITQILNSGVVPATLESDPNATALGTDLKEINAPVYQSSEGAMDGFGTATLAADTIAVESGSSTSDSTYTTVESDISTITAERDAVVTDIQTQLANALAGTPIPQASANTDEQESSCLLTYANQLKVYAANPIPANAPTDCNIATGPPPQTPEVGYSALLVLSAGILLAGALLFAGRRRRIQLI
jgi:hypothetical protein